MKHFGDPTFGYHVALARVLGVMALRIDEADVLPYDYPAYAAEIARAQNALVARLTRRGADPATLKSVSDASAEFTASAARASQGLHAIESASPDFAQQEKINVALLGVEQALLAPDGLSGRPWFKHTIYAPGSYAGYAAEMLPGITEALDRNDAITLQHEVDTLAAALHRAAAQLDEVTRLAQPPASPAVTSPASTSGH